MRSELENLMDNEFDEYLKSLWEEYHGEEDDSDGIIEENALVDSSVDAFKKLLSMLGDTFKQKERGHPKTAPVYNTGRLYRSIIRQEIQKRNEDLRTQTSNAHGL